MMLYSKKNNKKNPPDQKPVGVTMLSKISEKLSGYAVVGQFCYFLNWLILFFFLFY